MNAFGHTIETLRTYRLPDECSPHRLLAVAVIQQAVQDVATHLAKHGRAVETWAAHKDAENARDFLVRRLWSAECAWSHLYIPDLLTPSMRTTLVAYCAGVPMRVRGARHQRSPAEIADAREPV